MNRRLAIFLGIVVAATAGALLLPAISGETVNAQTEATPVPTVTAGRDTIWSGVVIATNAASPKPPPPELREFADRLERIFGYNQFELFGSAAKPISDRSERWLVPSQTFWLGVNARQATSKEARGGYLLNVQLFQNKRPLVDTEAKLAPGSPLFIRGPMYGSGQVIIVLQVKDGATQVVGKN